MLVFHLMLQLRRDIGTLDFRLYVDVHFAQCELFLMVVFSLIAG